MRIINIIPSSGGSFYCQNCLRDSMLVIALRALGHDAVAVPMYLPLKDDENKPFGDTPVFYGAVNAYLKQEVPLLRNAPRWVDRMLDAPGLLNFAAKRAGSTRASGLEDMTLSMLRGEDGNQARQLDDLVAWLHHEGKPDVVHLSNALLLGLVHRIKDELDVPVVCSLQDEDVWLDAMEPDQAAPIWELMSDRATEIDMFVPVSRYYGECMRKRLRTPQTRMRVVHIGIDLDGYTQSTLPFDPPVLGYLSRMSESLGLDILVDAFIKLRERGTFPGLRLHATGGMTGDDVQFVNGLRQTLAQHGLGDAAEFAPDFTRGERLAFLGGLTVMAVPVPGGEAFGTFQLEALAAGVPIVQPNAGAFPEIVEATGGGVCYAPNDPNTLADTLESLLGAPDRVKALGQHGRDVVERRFSAERMAKDMVAVYGEVLPDAGGHQ